MGYFEKVSKTLPEFQGSNWLLRIPFAIVFIQQGLSKLPLNVEDAEGFQINHMPLFPSELHEMRLMNAEVSE